MRRGRRLPLLELSQEQRTTLQGWTRRRKTAQALSMRARIVLRASEGLTATAIAAETHACIQTVSKWWRRFDAQGLDDLPQDWRTNQETTRDWGTGWLRKNRSALLQIPSAIVPETANFLFNPSHADAARFRISETFLYPFDVRLKK